MNDIQHSIESDDFENTSHYKNNYWLKPGIYVRAKADYDEKIKKGIVLLISSIDRVEGKDHKVNLYPHPEWSKHSNGYNFVANEFMEWFQPAPDGEDVREAEKARIQGRITQKTDEMNQGPSDLEIHLHLNSAKRIEQGEAPKNTEPAYTPESALTSMDNPEKALLLKDRLDTEYTLAEFTKCWFDKRVTDIRNTCEIVARFAAEKAKQALGTVQDSLELSNNLKKGLKTLSLYTGEDVSLYEICTGKSADSDEKVYLFQNKLWMDEESIAHTATGGLDCRHFDKFIEQLAIDKSLQDRIIPTQRGVVLIGYSRSSRREYENLDSSIRYELLKQNKEAFLIIKNGENFTAITAPLVVKTAVQLFPTVNDLNEPFRGVNGDQITIQDISYSERYENYKRQELRYKRLLILLWGLHDRLQIFGKEWGSVANHFTSSSFQERHFEFLYDGSFAIDESMPSYFEYINKNSAIQSGSRVMCYWRNLITLQSAPSCYLGRNSLYGDPFYEYSPDSESNICIVQKDKDGFFVKVEVSNNIRFFNARVSLEYLDHFGYVCLDKVKSDDLDYYINSRKERQHYLRYIPLFTEIKEHLSSLNKTWEPIQIRVLTALKMHSPLAKNILFNKFETLKQNFMIQNSKMFLNPLSPSDEEVIFNKMIEIFKKQEQISDSLFAYLDDKIQKDKISPILLTYSGKGRIELYAEILEPVLNIFPDQYPWVAKYIVKENKRSVTLSKPTVINFNERKDGAEILKEWSSKSKYSQANTTLKLSFKKEQILYRKMSEWQHLFKAPDDWEFEWNCIKDLIDELSGYYIKYPLKYIPIGISKSPFRDGCHTIINLKVNALEWLYFYSEKDQRDTIEEYLYDSYRDERGASNRIEHLKEINCIFDRVMLSFDSLSDIDEYNHHYHAYETLSTNLSWPVKVAAVKQRTLCEENLNKFFESCFIPDEKKINTYFRNHCPEKMIDSLEWQHMYK